MEAVQSLQVSVVCPVPRILPATPTPNTARRHDHDRAFTPTTGFTGTVTLGTVVAQGPKGHLLRNACIVQGSTDYAGKLTTAVSGCVLTFQNAYTNAPSCHFEPDTAVTGDASQAVTNTSLTVTAVGMTAFDYECIGLNE